MAWHVSHPFAYIFAMFSTPRHARTPNAHTNKSTALQNKILQLTAAERAKGVICNSAGNHAQAVRHVSVR